MDCNITGCNVGHIVEQGTYSRNDEHGHYPRLPEVARIILMVVLPVVCVVGIIGNCLVMWIFCRLVNFFSFQR